MKVILFDLGKTLEDQDILLPGAMEILQTLYELQTSNSENVAIALISDFTMPTQSDQIPTIQQEYYDILENLGIRSFFEPVEQKVTLSTEVGVFKPDEQIFRAAIDKISHGINFNDVMFVTENLHHVVAARNLEMTSIHYQGPGQSSGDIETLIGLIPLIQEFLGVDSFST